MDNALVSYVQEQQRAQSLQRTVDASRRAVELSGKRYLGGDVNFQRVLDSQRSLLLSENALALSQANVVLQLVSLYRALGGGWQTAPLPAAALEQVPGRPAGGDGELPIPAEALPGAEDA